MIGLPELLQRFRGLRVLVVGDAMLDTYVEGECSRISPEAPVPVVRVIGQRISPGGAANTAVNLSAMGAQVDLVSVTGDDTEAGRLRASLEERGVCVDDILTDRTRKTLAKQRICAGGQILLRVDQGDTLPVGGDTEARLIEVLQETVSNADAIVISDYEQGLLTPAVIQALADMRSFGEQTVVVDAKDLCKYQYLRPDAVKPNFQQAMALLSLDSADNGHRCDALLERGDRLLDITGARIVAVTLDSEGALTFSRGEPPYRTYADRSPGRTAGAGDTFVSLLALTLAAGARVPAASELASAAAAVVIGKPETAACTPAELMAYTGGKEKLVTDDAVLRVSLDFERQSGRRIVFTNGCFDILHAGHIAFLNNAKAAGDVLVVGLNSDASVSRIKGPSRPINEVEDRARVLAAMSCVDYIIVFEEDSPVEAIKRVRPDIFVKGGDYTREMLPEAALVEALGGTVKIMPYVEDRSTTGIIQRVREREALAQ